MSTRTKTRPKATPDAWAVALDAARNYAADALDPRGDAAWSRRDDYLEEVVAAVRAQSAPCCERAACDREMYERGIGSEAGYLFGVALATVMRGPWESLALWTDESPKAQRTPMDLASTSAVERVS